MVVNIYLKSLIQNQAFSILIVIQSQEVELDVARCQLGEGVQAHIPEHLLQGHLQAGGQEGMLSVSPRKSIQYGELCHQSSQMTSRLHRKNSFTRTPLQWGKGPGVKVRLFLYRGFSHLSNLLLSSAGYWGLFKDIFYVKIPFFNNNFFILVENISNAIGILLVSQIGKEILNSLTSCPLITNVNV